MIKQLALVAIVVLALNVFRTTPAKSHVYENEVFTIHHPWARASASGARNGAAYLRIESTSGIKDKLIGAQSPIADAVEIHETSIAAGVARMKKIPALDVSRENPADLSPGGTHLMLMGLKSPLKEGESFPLVLKFEKAGNISVDVIVESPGAMEPHGMIPDGHRGDTSPMHKH